MPWKRICCGIDFSAHSRFAMDQGAELARMYEADLVLVHVHETPSPGSGGMLLAPPELFTKMQGNAARELEAWRRQAEFLVDRPVRSILLSGDSAAEILRFARAISPVCSGSRLLAGRVSGRDKIDGTEGVTDRSL